MKHSGCRYRVVLPLALSVMLLASGGNAYPGEQPGQQFQGKSFALYVLSRGKGVPDDAWQVLEEMRALFSSQQAKDVSVIVHETIIGLEGERRICADFIDPEAARIAWERTETIIDGVELVNLRAETCMP